MQENDDSQEILIKNTYCNSILNQSPPEILQNLNFQKETFIKWKDNMQDDKQRLVTLYIPPYYEIQFKKTQIRPNSLAKQKNGTYDSIEHNKL